MTLDHWRTALREMLKNGLMALPWVASWRSRAGGGRTTGFYGVEEARGRVLASLEALRLPAVEGPVLEVGPGAHLGVLLTCLARGASRGLAVDRFPERAPFESSLYCSLGLDASLVEEGLSRSGRVGFLAGAVEDLRTGGFSLAYSYHSLQHVWGLRRAARALFEALAPGGLTVHVVDLRALGNVDPSGAEPLRHLEFPGWVWWLMGSQRGLPNRVLASGYRRAFADAGFSGVEVETLRSFEGPLPRLDAGFRGLPEEDLRPLEIRLTARRP